MDQLLNAIGGQVFSGAADWGKQALKQKNEHWTAAIKDSKTDEAIVQELLTNYGNEEYYNDVCCYISERNIFNNLRITLRNQGDLQQKSKAEFVSSNKNAFFEQFQGKTYSHNSAVIEKVEEIFAFIFDTVYEEVTYIDPYSDTGKLAIQARTQFETSQSERELISQRLTSLEKNVAQLTTAQINQQARLSATIATEYEKEIRRVNNTFQKAQKYREAKEEYTKIQYRLLKAASDLPQDEKDTLLSMLAENYALCCANLGEIESADSYLREIRDNPVFYNRENALFVCAAVDVYYHDEPDYKDSLELIETALAINPHYYDAFLLKQLIKQRTGAADAETIIEELDMFFKDSAIIPQAEMGSYYVHKGLILREVWRLDDAIQSYEAAKEYGYDVVIINYNLAAAYYSKAVQDNPLDKRIVLPKINYSSLLISYEYLKEIIETTKDNEAYSKVFRQSSELYYSACVLLGIEPKNCYTDKELADPAFPYELKRMVLLVPGKRLSDEELSYLSEEDRHFAKVRNLLQEKDFSGCKEYIESLQTIGFPLTAPFYNILMRVYIELADFDGYKRIRASAEESGVGEWYLLIHDADLALKQGDLATATGIYDDIAARAIAYEVLNVALQFYASHQMTEKQDALLRRIIEKSDNKELYIFNSEYFYTEAIQFYAERDLDYAKVLLSKLNDSNSSEFRRCQLGIVIGEADTDYNTVADVALRAFTLKGTYQEGQHAVMALIMLLKYDKALEIEQQVISKAPNNEELCRCYMVMSELLLLKGDLDGSYAQIKKAHEVTELIPSHPSHQLYMQRSLRCGHHEGLNESLAYKEEHPKVVNWLQPFYLKEDAGPEELFEELSRIADIETPSLYEEKRLGLIEKYKKSEIPLHVLLQFWNFSLINLLIYNQKYKIIVSDGDRTHLYEQAEAIDNKIVVDAYTLIVLALCDCLELMNEFKTVYIPFETVGLLHYLFLTEDNDACSSVLRWLQSAKSVQLCPNGRRKAEKFNRVFAKDVIPCCSAAVRFAVPYMSCETLLERLLDGTISELPSAKYVSVVAALAKMFQGREKESALFRYKLLKKCSFISFNAGDVLTILEENNWQIEQSILSPFFCFHSGSDAKSFVMVYFVTGLALDDNDIVLQDNYFNLLADYAEKVWRKGQIYRDSESNHRNEYEWRSESIATFVLQLLFAIRASYNYKERTIPESIQNRTGILIKRVMTECRYSWEDVNKRVQSLFEE